MPQRLRIFLSSPGDVGEERLRAHLVIQKLARDYARFFRIEPYLWEYEPMLASGHFQDAIEPPSACDVLVLILYARLGTPLPEHTTVRDYRGIDGRAPVTGTEWEFEEALEAHRRRGAPDLLAYRKVGDPGASLTDPVRRAEQERQWELLQAFWTRHFERGGLFLAGSAQFRTLEEFDRQLEAHLTALIEKRIASGLAGEAADEAAHWLRGSPFRGLAQYDFDDAPIFFGRDAQTRAALTRLQAAAGTGCAFLLVLGASGSGKSSLARAGILHALFEPKAVQGVGVWRRAVFRPADGPDPVTNLARAVATGDPATGVGLPEILGSGLGADTLAAHLAAAPDDPSYPFRVALERVADTGRARGLLPHETARLVILVDQLEELFTRPVDPARRDLFVRILAGLARSGVVWVVATLRNDFWQHVARAPRLLEAVEAGARLDLVQPDASEIIEIIRRPAKAAGLRFETAPDAGVGLDAVMAKAAAEEPGSLPLLSVMLDTLYERDVAAPAAEGRAGHVLTFASYAALGELRGAIARRADGVLHALGQSDPEAAAALPRVLRALVTGASGHRVASRPARLDTFAEGSPEARLIAAFLAPQARLLVTSAAEAGAEVRLAHEALIENWPAARDQIARDRRDLETRARLEALEKRWAQAAGADKPRALLSGLNLAEGVDLVRRWGIPAASGNPAASGVPAASGNPAASGLGLFVAASERADRRRRNRVAVAAAALVLVFAGIAATAGLQWRRAERQADAARVAAQAEREARGLAERDRAEAERQRARAAENERRALAGLRETARALASQAEQAAGQHDVRRALAFAVQAAETERDVLADGQQAVSEPALLRAMADVREAFQVRGPSKGIATGVATPYAFVGDTMLAWGDGKGGLVFADLAPRVPVVKRVALPDGLIAIRIRPVSSANLVVLSGGRHLLLVDPASARIAADIGLPAPITGLDVHEASGLIAVAAGAAVALVPVLRPPDGGDDRRLGEPQLVPVPNGRANLAVAQVGFDATGRALYATYGAAVLRLDLETRRFAESPVTELDARPAGLDRSLHERVLEQGRGLVSVVGLAPDPTRDRVLLWTDLSLQAFDPASGATRTVDRGGSDRLVLGLGFTDQAHTGTPKEAVAVLGTRQETEQELTANYLLDDGTLIAFDRFAVRTSDFGGQKLHSCRPSAAASFVACQSWSETDLGITVWRLNGGSHRFERLLMRDGGSGILKTDGGSSALIAAADGAVTAVAVQPDGESRERRIAGLPAGWQLRGLAGPYLLASSEPGDSVRIFRWDGATEAAQPLLGPVEASDALLDASADRAVLRERDQLSAYDLRTGGRLWTLPGLAGLEAASLSNDGSRLVALARDAVYRVDAATGRLLGSRPLAREAGSPAAVAPDGTVAALVGADGRPALHGLETGEVRPLAAGCKPARIAWSPDGALVLIGCRTGAVLAFDRDGSTRWSVPSPLGPAFSETEAWPDQPPKGLVLDLAVSPESGRIAVVRQDLPSVDLHDAASGRYLTRLTPPWSFGVPARVVLGPDGLVLTSWAVHAMARAKPRRITVHRLPHTFPEALAAAAARRAALDDVRPYGGVAD